MSKISKIEIEKYIFIARKHKVMLDIDLARIYGVETRILNQAGNLGKGASSTSNQKMLTCVYLD